MGVRVRRDPQRDRAGAVVTYLPASVMVYVSEQTNTRRPGIRLVCTCGWGVVAVHADTTRPLTEIITEAAAHVNDAHRTAEETPVSTIVERDRAHWWELPGAPKPLPGDFQFFDEYVTACAAWEARP